MIRHNAKYLLIWLSTSSIGHADLQPFNDEDLSDINGAGIAIYTENLSLDTRDSNPDNAGEISITANEFNDITLKNLKVFKAGTNYTQGADVGSTTEPLRLNIVEKDMPDGARRDVAILDIPTNPDALDISYESYFRPILVDAAGIRSATPNEQLFAQIEIEGYQLNKSIVEIWATEEDGLNVASNISADIDSLNIIGDPDNQDAAKTSIKGVKIKNLQNGSEHQPLTMRVIDAPSYYLPVGSTNLQMKMVSTLQLEIAPLTSSIATSLYTNPDTGNPYTAEEYRGTLTDISVKELNFTNQHATGSVNGQTQLAFIPQNPSENVIEVQGMEIQSMKVTFHDLNY
ncbi:hypothetical protein [Parendozoicomonas sp. Alg238-R29]|uniref:hypothetical protein n=1 Tax=Parendozoicomonas sp. Alg238-R29 TaxID=2993446 RepID=UPI00248E993A|nr:hypothetical protein [Parendozoicomonas sp. Alg238-R29]